MTRRQRQEAVHDRPVRARGLEALDAAERDLLQEVVVRAGEAAERTALRHRRDLRRLLDRALEHDDLAAGCHVEGLHVALAGDDALDRPRPRRCTRARCRLPRSSRRNSTARPSGVKRGLVTLRSSAAVSDREAPPATGARATWLAPYQKSFGSPPAT